MCNRYSVFSCSETGQTAATVAESLQLLYKPLRVSPKIVEGVDKMYYFYFSGRLSGNPIFFESKIKLKLKLN